MVYSDCKKQRIVFWRNEGLKAPSICKKLRSEGLSCMREGGGETTVAKLQKLLEIEIRPPSFEECYYDSTMPKAATCMEFLWYCILPARLRAEQGEAISLGEGEKR